MSQLRGEIAVATGASKGIGASQAEPPMNEQLLTENASPKQVLLKFYEAEANYMKAFEEAAPPALTRCRQRWIRR